MTPMRNVLVAILTLAAVASAGEKVVVYVSLDEQYSGRLLADFTKQTGIAVEPTYDTERSKTVGLVNRLIREKADPQADVYWNNEVATTVKLKQAGVLQAYVSPSAADIPAAFKDPDSTWTGFAARARILIVNTDRVSPDEMPRSMWDLTKPRWRGKVCMARPETGTTAAHAAALYVLDPELEDKYFDALIANDVVWLSGNAHCMREVSAGRFAFGWTDTDDFNVALTKGAPVVRVFPDAGPDDIGVLYIPNSLMLIRGARHPAAAKRLIDWLLRPEIEARLARSAAAQIPVRRNVPVPPNVLRPDQVGKVMAVDWDRVGREYDRWVPHLKARLEQAHPGASGRLLLILGVVAVLGLAGVVLLKRTTGEPR